MKTRRQTSRAPGLYQCSLSHQRMDRLGYRFEYRLFSLCLDVDNLEQQAAAVRGLSINTFNLASLNLRDHGPRDGSALRPWVEAQLQRQGCQQRPARILLIAMPRLLGFVFNPLSAYFCEDGEGHCFAAVLEVKNTFGEQHPYVVCDHCAHQDRKRGFLEGGAAKIFHVSPFLSRSGHYRFRLRPPSDELSLEILLIQQDRPVLAAVQQGRHQPLTTTALLRTLAVTPGMTLKVMAAIHWQALKLWLRGGQVHDHSSSSSLSKESLS